MQSICEEEDLLCKAKVHFKVSSEISVTELDLSDHSETKFQLADSSNPSSTLETIIKANTKHAFPLRHRPRLPDISAAKNDSGISIGSSLDLINADE